MGISGVYQTLIFTISGNFCIYRLACLSNHVKSLKEILIYIYIYIYIYMIIYIAVYVFSYLCDMQN